jgi:hypothetical protein
VTFNVTPAANAPVNTNNRISALYTSGSANGYTDQVMRVVSAVEGRFQRWGNWAEYDNWIENTAPAARRLGRSAAIQTTGVGETFTLPVVVHNWTDTAQSGNAFWMTRAELGSNDAGFRPSLFADLGWVGDRTKLSQIGRPMSGVGTGASFLDGLFRFDVARGLYPRKQFRVDFYLESKF